MQNKRERERALERELLEMLLLGYGLKAAQLAQQIEEVRARLARACNADLITQFGKPATLNPRKAARASNAPAELPACCEPKRRRPRLSPAGRARIVAATKARWARFHKAHAKKAGHK